VPGSLFLDFDARCGDDDDMFSPERQTPPHTRTARAQPKLAQVPEQSKFTHSAYLVAAGHLHILALVLDLRMAYYPPAM